jgi:hypothetical protein
MIIDKVIMSCNDDPFYSDYWPIVSKVWKVKMGIDPVLVYFGDASKMSTEYGTVVEMEKLDDVPMHTQAQWGRFWYTQFEPETMWLISDIDMMPLSKEYFVNSIEAVPREIEPIVHFNTNIEYSSDREGWDIESPPAAHETYLPTCYSAGSGKIRKESLDLVPSFKESIENLKWKENVYDHAPNGVVCSHWYAEESYQEDKLKEWIAMHPDRFFSVVRPNGYCSNRLDRGHGVMPEWNKEALQSGVYMDFHMPRPWAQFGEQIQEVADSLMEVPV